jgi:hypothetical protein
MTFRIVRRDEGVASMARLPHSQRERQQARTKRDEEKEASGSTPEVRSEPEPTTDALGYLEDGELRRHQATRLAGPHAARPSLLEKHEALLLWYRLRENCD